MSDLITRKPTPIMVEMLRQGAANPKGIITMADHNDRTQDGLLRRDMADVVDAGPWLSHLVITDRGRAYLAKLDAAEEAAERRAASQHEAAHDAHFHNADGTFRADRSQQAYMSAVDNADQTAREEGYERGTDQWFRVVLSSYASLIDDGAYTEPAPAAQEAVSAPQAAEERPAVPEEPQAPAAPEEAAPFVPVRLHFEMEVCGRCGGTGEHQYNQRDGHVCWGCTGKKERMTRRANTAYDAYEAALPETAAATYVRDLAPGMVIRSKAHGGLSGATPWDYKPAWRRVESVRFEEFTGRGCVKGMIVDVACVRAEITFADGKTWTAVSSDDPAYWNRGAFHTIHTTRCFRLAGEEARRALDAVRRAIARRFTGAWLEGEQPPAAPVRKPRAAKPAPVADGPQEAPKPAPLPVNRFPGDCRRCGGHVAAEEGERLKMDGRWAVQHRDGECPAADAAQAPAQEAQERPQERQERQERPAMVNRYAGRCGGCGGRVAAGAGVRVRDGGAWVTRHGEGDCRS